MSVSPFTITVENSKVELLKRKLELSSFPDELEGAEWAYGTPLADVKRLVQYWKDGFDWQKQVNILNELPNYRAKISVDGFDALDIHFVHQKSLNAEAIPLLFCHGWPGSFLEVSKLLPFLKGDTDNPAFNVVALSLPNFGFSSGVTKRGFGMSQYAETCHKLMLTLGYEKYVTQGGDWGFYITRAIGLLYPKNCLASHINMIRASAPTATTHPLLALQHSMMPYTERERRGLARQKWFLNEGSGYRSEQATKPQTLGYSLADSPVGLLAWIYEKLHDWTDDYPWTDDEILTWISIYYFSTAGPAASVRIYYEATHDNVGIGRERTTRWIGGVPLGMAHFPRELGVVPRTWARTLGPVVWESEHNKGGHFAAWERPGSIASDLNGMFGKKGPCAGIIQGKSGY